MKKKTHFFLSLLLICLSASLLGFFISSMRHTAKSNTDLLSRSELKIDAGIFAKQDIPEKLLPELIDSAGEGENLIYYFDNDAQYSINQFLTCFSEQFFGTYDPDDSDALVDFAYQFLLLHRDDRLPKDYGFPDTVGEAMTAVDLNYVLKSNAVDSVTERFFGKTVQHTEDTYYYLNAGINIGNRISVAKAMYANEDGSYTVEFDMYDTNPQPISCPFSQEDLMNAEPIEGVNGSPSFPLYARSAYPNQDWDWLGTTSGALDPNPNSYLGYNVYRVSSFGESLMFVSPVGNELNTVEEVYAYDTASHTMKLVFSDGSFIDSAYLTLSDPSARVHPDLTYIGSGTAVVQNYGDTWNSSYQLISYDVEESESHQAVRFGPNGQYRINIFLSNFSEQNYWYYNPNDKDALINFAYLFLKINDFSALEYDETDPTRIMLPSSTVDQVLYRFFGRTIKHTESAYYFPMADGESYSRFSVATIMESNGDGTYKVAFNIYELSPTDNYYDSVPSEYYSLTTSGVWQRADVSYCGSGSAVIREVINGGYTSYQVISYYSLTTQE